MKLIKNSFLNMTGPVLIVNSDYLELQSNKSDYDLLLGKLLDYFNKPEGAKMYFNPAPTLI